MTTMKDLILTHAPRGAMARRLASLCVRPDAECYYFGCIERAGHYLWRKRDQIGRASCRERVSSPV